MSILNDITGLITSVASDAISNYTADDPRCYFSARSNGSKYVFGETGRNEIMDPLAKSKRLIFPYTPTIQVGGGADYEQYSYTHTNYNYNAYNRSAPSEITITGDFTAQTTSEAAYLLAVMHFFRSVTKSYFGASTPERSGTPPPVVLFNYLGQYMFNDVPVIIKNYAYTLQPDVSYIEVPFKNTSVPTYVNITVTIEASYPPKSIRDEFNLDDFRSGSLVRDKGFI